MIICVWPFGLEGLWLRYAAKFIPSFPWIAPPRPPPWKGRDQILPSGNTVAYRVVGKHGAALGSQAVSPGGGGGGLDHLVEGDRVDLSGAHDIARLEGLEEEEVELPVYTDSQKG